MRIIRRSDSGEYEPRQPFEYTPSRGGLSLTITTTQTAAKAHQLTMTLGYC